ncbi:MAG: cyanophycin synthetase [Clostridiales bacterium]|nr:cyanophycin synthetase [Clostridiales bacterium]
METETIKICDFTIFHGRNIYSHRPIMKMIVDIGKYGNIPTKDIPGFNDKLLKALPGLKKNCCSLGYEGGFLERLNEGTYLAHVLEHVILEMQYSLGYNVGYGKTRVIEEPSLFYLAYEYENEVCGLECSKASVFILNCFINGEDIDIKEFLEYLQKVSIDAELGPSTSAIAEEAKKRNIPITRIGNESLVQLGYGKYSKLIESTLTNATSCISADISSNKQLTKAILSDQKIPVPYGKVVYSEISAVMIANQIGMPVVLKPFDGNQGKGVFLNLTKDSEIKAAFREASKFSNGIIVEKYITGKDYRILVVGDKVTAVAQRLPACVIGDGKHTIEELVEITNRDPNRGDQHEKKLTKIRLDTVSIEVLKKKGLNIHSIPLKGEEISLRNNGNLSTGGTAIDCTDKIHPDNTEIAIQAAQAIGIDIAGIDIVAEDISKSILDTDGAVVEVNTAPGIRMHLYPSIGKPRNVAKDIIDMLFPNEESCHFPIVSVTGTNGKTTTVRLISHVLTMAGRTVGMTSTNGTFIDGKCVCRGDNSGPRSAKSLLSNKKIDTAVLETARGGIVREGLGYDLADVGVITNITDDHLGINGIDTLEDLAYVKALVVEAVKKDGAAVLNAEDKMTPEILKRIKVNPILFYRNAEAIRQYQSLDCIRVFEKNGWIIIQDGNKTSSIVRTQNIPITFDGLIECNIENCLAAVSALYALHVPVEIIAAGLKTFEYNTGRFNLYEMNGYKVMLDYGHNPAGYQEVIKTCKKIGGKRLIGVIGMPGDRMDLAIQNVGQLCASAFDRIYIKEDIELRGKKRGEVAGLLYSSIKEAGFPLQNAKIIEKEVDALKTAVKDAKNGDLIVVLYEKMEPLHHYLESVLSENTHQN